MKRPIGSENQVIWLNGEFVPWDDANFHVLNHGLHYGLGVFEGLRSYNGRPFRAVSHFERLLDSARTLGIEVGFSVFELSQGLDAVIARNHLENAYLRAIAFVLSEDGMKLRVTNSTQVALAGWPMGQYFERYQPKSGSPKGLSLVLTGATKPSGLPYGAKICGLYALHWLARKNHMQFDDVILLDAKGFLAETTVSNVFIVKGLSVKTPKLGSILPGVTREAVIEIVGSCPDLLFEEEDITPQDLMLADEVFITGTAVEVGLVGSIKSGIPGIQDFCSRTTRVFDRIAQKYRDVTRG